MVMDNEKYIHYNLPILREITICNENILRICVHEGILLEEEKTSLDDLSIVERKLNFWRKISEKNCSMKVLEDIFYEHYQYRVADILYKACYSNAIEHRHSFINNLQPLLVNVRKPELEIVHKDDFYKLKPEVIGFALLINITKYEKYGRKRHRCNQDTEYMHLLWSQLGFRIYKYEGSFSAFKFKEIVSNFLSDVKKAKHIMSYVIYIGSHGNKGNIELSNGENISLCDDLILPFADSSLKDKPKLFIIQVSGLISNSVSEEQQLNNSLDNTVICYLTEPKEHCQYLGSWLLYSLVDTFMYEACSKDLASLLEKLRENINHGLDNGSDDTLRDKIFTYKNYGMKTLYFNVRNRPLEYYKYFSSQKYRLLEIPVAVETMGSIIDSCVTEGILSVEDQDHLSILENRDIPETFWTKVSTAENCISKLADIFYAQKIPEVVRVLFQAKKDDGSDDVYQFLENLPILNVKVKRESRLVVPKMPPDHYTLDEDLIGLALIINIFDYEKCGRRRHGAEHDTVYMKELWTQLGYKVMTYEGYITQTDLENILQKYKAKFTKLNGMVKEDGKKVYQSCLVYIGCHGSQGTLLMSDETPVPFYEQFIYKFKYLTGIPKIFIVQCCQTYENETSGDVTSVTTEMLDEMADMIICFPTIPGERSRRDVFVGSYFVYTLANVFMNNAYKDELELLLYKVAIRLIFDFCCQDDPQFSIFKSYKMKTLYFNVKPLAP